MRRRGSRKEDGCFFVPSSRSSIFPPRSLSSRGFPPFVPAAPGFTSVQNRPHAAQQPGCFEQPGCGGSGASREQFGAAPAAGREVFRRMGRRGIAPLEWPRENFASEARSLSAAAKRDGGAL